MSHLKIVDVGILLSASRLIRLQSKWEILWGNINGKEEKRNQKKEISLPNGTALFNNDRPRSRTDFLWPT
jgi:hypothetical protein